MAPRACSTRRWRASRRGTRRRDSPRSPTEIDLLVVDGPPAYDPVHETRRAPALRRLDTRLVAGAALVLDDIARAAEREVLAGWEATTDWRFAVDERAGVAIGRRQHDPHAPDRTVAGTRFTLDRGGRHRASCGADGHRERPL
jgi:hypothetical protein